MNIRKQIMATVLILSASCDKVEQSGKNTEDVDIILEPDAIHQVSEKNDWALVFAGYRVKNPDVDFPLDNKLFPRQIFFENKNRERFFFSPADPASVEQSGFVVNPAWSPDGSWVVLPNGRFEGFIAFDSNTLPKGLNDPSKARVINVAGPDGSRWWHEFDQWQSPTVFRFRAGLSGDYSLFEYDFSSGSIKPAKQ